MDVAEILLRLSGEDDGASDAVSGLRDRLAELRNESVRVSLDDTDVGTKLDDIKAQLAKLHDEHVDVAVDDGDAATKIDVLREELARINDQVVQIKVDDAGADAKVDELKAELEALHDKDVRVRVHADDDGSMERENHWMAMLGVTALAVGPQILTAVGQGILGLGALTVATGGAATAFGALGYAVYDAIKNKASPAAREVSADLTTLKSQLMSALGPAVQQVLGGLASLLTSLGPTVKTLSGPFLTLGTAIKTALSSVDVQNGIKSLVSGFGEIVTESAPLVGPVLTGLLSLGKILENIAKAAMPVLVTEAGKFADWLGKIAGSTGNTDKLREEISKLTGEFNAVLQAVVKVWDALKPLFESSSGFMPLIDVVTTLVKEFDDLLESMGPVGRLIMGGLGVVLLTAKFGGMHNAMALVTGSGKLLYASLKSLATGSLEPLITMFPKIAAALGLTAAAEGETAAAAVPLDASLIATDAAATPLIATLGALALAAAPWILAIGAVVAAVLLAIKFHKQLEQVVVAVWDAIESVVKTVISHVGDAILLLLGPLGLVIQFHKQLEDAVSAAWKFVESVISKAVSDIASILDSAWKAIEKAATTAWKDVEDVFSIAWKDLEKAVSTGIKAVVGFVAALPGDVLHALGDIGSFLANAGKDLVQGFINGIESMFSAVTGVAGDLLSKLGGAVTSILGISSPSKVAHTWGEMVGEGMAQGIESKPESTE